MYPSTGREERPGQIRTITVDGCSVSHPAAVDGALGSEAEPGILESVDVFPGVVEVHNSLRALERHLAAVGLGPLAVAPALPVQLVVRVLVVLPQYNRCRTEESVSTAPV